MKRLYLAGPEVFRRDAAPAGEEMKALCAQHGFLGVYPLDAELAMGDGALSRRIFEANVASIRSCDGLVANLSPFRGPSADVGTVFEVAHALAIGKPVFAYTEGASTYASRIAESHGPLREADGRLLASDGMCVEDFGLAENLMVVEAIRAQGWDLAACECEAGGFLACLRAAAAYFATGPA